MTVANAMNHFFTENPNKVLNLSVTSKNGYEICYYTKEDFNAERFSEFYDRTVISIFYNQNTNSLFQIPIVRIRCE